MAIPLGVSINYAQWGFAPATFGAVDPFLNNLRYALDLTLTGLANLIFADDAGTVNMSVAMTVAAIHAFETAPNPGPTNASWRRALDQAVMLKGGSWTGWPLNAKPRFEGRPEVFSAGEVIGL